MTVELSSATALQGDAVLQGVGPTQAPQCGFGNGRGIAKRHAAAKSVNTAQVLERVVSDSHLLAARHAQRVKSRTDSQRPRW